MMWSDLNEELSQLYFKNSWDAQTDAWFKAKLLSDEVGRVDHRAWYYRNKHRAEVRNKIKRNNDARYKSNIKGRIPKPVTCGHPENKHKGNGLCVKCYFLRVRETKKALL